MGLLYHGSQIETRKSATGKLYVHCSEEEMEVFNDFGVRWVECDLDPQIALDNCECHICLLSEKCEKLKPCLDEASCGNN